MMDFVIDFVAFYTVEKINFYDDVFFKEFVGFSIERGFVKRNFFLFKLVHDVRYCHGELRLC